MTPERWRQVTAIFHAARTREPEARPAVLEQMCGADTSLRAEVNSLLAAHAEAGRSGQTAVSIDLLPQLSPGTTFGPYRVEGLLGAGGMGQVYRATDPRLRRTVAIKVLSPGLSDDPDFDARFEREARLLASLSHPNIAAIHGLEESDGVTGLVLEFIEGPTLADRLGRGRMPISEALTIAKQIALALEAAHEKGIVHRDLKPANIKITPAGVVKVLDFGIARIAEAGGSFMTTAAGTGTGIILGTPAYMSPEQARGLAVDKRTDVWAFGCVLFEMLTGRGVFAGDTASDSLAKVIEREPDWTALPAGVPQPIRRLLTRCLQKQASERLHDIADARIEIADALAHGPTVDAPQTVTVVYRIPVALVLAAVALVAIVGLAMWKSWTPAPVATAPSTEFGVTFPNNYIPAFGVAVSPDGRSLAVGVFANSSQLWLHSFQGAETRPLPGGENGAGPFWSPDSSKIGFFAGQNLMTIGVTGGTPTFVTAAPGNQGGTWNRDGVILYASADKLWRIAASGGTPGDVPLSGAAGTPLNPIFLPDGRHFVFFAFRRGGGTMQLASLDSPQVTTLVESDRPGTFAPPDRVLFVRRASLMSQRLDMRRLVLDGEPELVASGVTHGMASQTAPVPISASNTGVLAFTAPRGGSAGQLTWFTREGRSDASLAPQAGDNEYLNPRISPDGAAVAANVIDPALGTSDIWLIDPARHVSSKLTNDPGSETDGVWSPDGKEMAYVVNRAGRQGLYRQPVAGGTPELVADLSEFRIAIATDWSRDGSILFQAVKVASWSIWAVPLSGGRQPIQILDDRTYGGHLSPDGRWLAYSAFETDQFEVYVRPFRGDAPKKQISHGGGVHPRWTQDGKELVYWAPPRGIFANDVTISGSDIVVGPTRTLVDRPVLSLIDGRTHYDVTRDGRRLLVRQPTGASRSGIRVLLNWMSKPK